RGRRGAPPPARRAGGPRAGEHHLVGAHRPAADDRRGAPGGRNRHPERDPRRGARGDARRDRGRRVDARRRGRRGGVVERVDQPAV
ncbi:MAG: Ribosomal protein L11 methyltransferase, partial [uncultured Gemmatimonadaceae bacterium]